MTNANSVILIVVDGMRPDGLQQADTPTIDRLIAGGAHTLSARSVMPSITLPCHVSMFHGVTPEAHGITTNILVPHNPPLVGLFEVLQAAGKKTAMFHNWEELRDLSRPGYLEASLYLKNCHDPLGAGDTELAEQTYDWLSRNPVDFTFVYLGYTDVAGHDYGWMSEPYLQGIANADHCIGRIISALPEECAVIITSDHGGHGKSHGSDCDEDMLIPLVISGPGIPTGTRIDRPVDLTDLAPTIVSLLGIAPPPEWMGKALHF